MVQQHQKGTHCIQLGGGWGADKAGGLGRERESRSPFPSVSLLPCNGLLESAPALYLVQIEKGCLWRDLAHPIAV